MAEQQQQQQQQREAQERARRATERRREGEEETTKVAAQLASLGAETISTWTDLNQRITQDLLRMSSTAAEETTRAFSEVNQATMAAWREAQGSVMRWQTLWPEAFRDPFRWYQHAFQHAVTTMQDAIDLNRRNAETVMRSFDRMQSQSEEAAKTLEDTFRQGASKIREIQSRTENLRVA
jgi:hypothetical protein